MLLLLHPEGRKGGGGRQQAKTNADDVTGGGVEGIFDRKISGKAVGINEILIEKSVPTTLFALSRTPSGEDELFGRLMEKEK